MGNPLVPQGLLNRVKASVVFQDHPELQVTAPYLGDDGISLALEGEATLYLPQMTGAVVSPEPYMMITLTIALIRTQALADQYKQAMENSSPLGNATVYPDIANPGNGAGIGVYALYNTAIKNVRELQFNGKNAGWHVTVGGYYLTNNSLFN